MHKSPLQQRPQDPPVKHSYFYTKAEVDALLRLLAGRYAIVTPRSPR